jgi:hypothetical protein
MRRVLAATLWLVIAVSAAAHGSSRSLSFHFSNDDEGSDDPGADAADSTQSTDLAETSYGHGRAHRMRRTVATGPNGEAININLNVDRDEEGVSAQRGGEANFHAEVFLRVTSCFLLHPLIITADYRGRHNSGYGNYDWWCSISTMDALPPATRVSREVAGWRIRVDIAY